MGLTRESIGYHTVDGGLNLEKTSPNDKIIALAGNPNVGKSTVFNNLTGMNQHTGNWPGKTVATAVGRHACHGREYLFVDLPGTYSLMAHSAEEEVARDFICYGGADAVAVVCDATCLERNLNLVLQTMEISPHVVVCVNLMDEAKKKHIEIDLEAASKILGVPVVGASARSGKGLDDFMEAVKTVAESPQTPMQVSYLGPIEEAIRLLEPQVKKRVGDALSPRWVSLKLLDDSQTIDNSLKEYLGFSLLEDEIIKKQLEKALRLLDSSGISKEKLRDRLVSSIVTSAKKVAARCVTFQKENFNARDRKLDKILTNKWTGIPIMLLLLAGIFWLTITGSNYPSSLLSTGLFWIQDRLMELFNYFHAPEWLSGALVLGVYRVLAWVVAVMLPPMAIFFPLFTLLEDFGYLPRVAFNLDHQFKKACTCGKQALTMCQWKPMLSLIFLFDP